MKWLISLIIAVLRVLLPWAVNQSRPTAQDADPDRGLRDRLRARVRKHGLAPMVLIAPLLMAGCGSGSLFTRTIYVYDGTPVRLRETVKDAKVWVTDADGKVVAGEMDIPEGWYALPVPDEE